MLYWQDAAVTAKDKVGTTLPSSISPPRLIYLGRNMFILDWLVNCAAVSIISRLSVGPCVDNSQHFELRDFFALNVVLNFCYFLCIITLLLIGFMISALFLVRHDCVIFWISDPGMDRIGIYPREKDKKRKE